MNTEGHPTSPNKELRRRSRNACDACRARKVKCDYDGSSCQACGELQIACTHSKPRKRRGPLNQYVLAQGRANLAPSDSQSPASVAVCGTDRLAPFPIIENILHDWFELIHSVAPIFHRGTFLSRLAAGEAAQDCQFSALVISVCGATISSLKRKSSIDYGGLTAERCLEVAEQIQLQIGKQPCTLEWCQTKYNLGTSLMVERGFDDSETFRLLGEAVTGLKWLVYYEMPRMSTFTQQLLKRLYWLLFVGLCTLDMHGRPYIGLLSPQDNISALTPLELSDNELEPTQAPGPPDGWHGCTRSYVPGLNHLIKLFHLWYQSQQGDDNTIARLQHFTNLVQRALDYLPPELRWRGGLSRPPQSNFGTDVQTANLYITQLHIRSSLLAQMNQLVKTSGIPQTPPELISERQSIVEDMLEILYHMPQETLEANGYSLVPKIRDIGSALLDEVRTGDRAQGMSPKASVNLDRLLAKLESLDAQSQIQYMEMGPVPGLHGG